MVGPLTDAVIMYSNASRSHSVRLILSFVSCVFRCLKNRENIIPDMNHTGPVTIDDRRMIVCSSCGFR